MLDRFVLGTANFSQNYGILSQGDALAVDEVNQILSVAKSESLDTVDMAQAYGESQIDAKAFEYFRVISKWSIADDVEAVYRSLKSDLKKYGKSNFYALMIHDPQNLDRVDSLALASFCQRIRAEGMAERIGISIYTEDDWRACQKVMKPEIVQLPLNPMNQLLNNDSFKQELADKGVEVHARSLFLQGVLLGHELPSNFDELEYIWQRFCHITKEYSERLAAILSWSLSQKWIHKWVVGVASANHLRQIARAVEVSQDLTAPCFDELKDMYHPMVDPRNWKVS